MIPPSFIPATEHGVLPQQDDGELAFSVKTSAGIIRLRMAEDEALQLISVLLGEMRYRRTRTKAHSAISSGMPSADVSPKDGQSQ